jgi:hypothetical protein
MSGAEARGAAGDGCRLIANLGVAPVRGGICRAIGAAPGAALAGRTGVAHTDATGGATKAPDPANPANPAAPTDATASTAATGAPDAAGANRTGVARLNDAPARRAADATGAARADVASTNTTDAAAAPGTLYAAGSLVASGIADTDPTAGPTTTL